MENTTGIMLTCGFLFFVMIMVAVVMNRDGANRSKNGASEPDRGFHRSYEGRGTTILAQVQADWDEYLLGVPISARGDFLLHAKVDEPWTVKRMDAAWWFRQGYGTDVVMRLEYSKTERLKNVSKPNLPQVLFATESEWVHAVARMPANVMKVTVSFDRYREASQEKTEVELLAAKLEADPELRAELLLHGISIKLNEHNKVDNKEK